MNYSIIIPNLNQEERLALNLNQIFKQIDRRNTEVIVIDNGSSDASKSLVEKHPIIWLENRIAQNPYISRNMGIRQALGEILIFVDASCVPCDDWFLEGTKHIKQGKDVVVGQFKIDISKNRKLEELAYALMYLNNQEEEKAIPAGNFFCRKEVFDNVGLFNEEARSGGDTAWSEKLRKQDVSVHFEPFARVHYQAKSGKSFYEAIKRFGRGARQQWLPSKGKIRVFLIAISYLFPLSFGLISKRGRYKNLHLSKKETVLSWFCIWKARIIFATKMMGF